MKIRTNSSFERLFERQKLFNEQIRSGESLEFWTEKYLLGIVSEIDEVLEQIKWKRHRKGTGDPNIDNIGNELADLTKYVMSLWELYGFEWWEVIEKTHEKSEMLEQLYLQETAVIPSDSFVLIVDFDGTLANYRKGFLEWAGYPSEDPEISLSIDSDFVVSYPKYYDEKEKFEAEGGYRDLEPYYDAIFAVRALKSLGAYVIAYTARPASRYKRIWMDTWHWLKDRSIKVDQLWIGSEARVLEASNLSKKGCKVVMFEDDPLMIRRAVNSGIRVFARKFAYNSGINNKLLTYVTSYQDLDVSNILKGE